MQDSPGKRSPSKHKGVKTSLLNSRVQMVNDSLNPSYIPNRIYVQTVNDSNYPNVFPYIQNMDSHYSHAAQSVNESKSQYFPSNKTFVQQGLQNDNQRQNRHIYQNVTYQNVPAQRISPIHTNSRVSPLHGGTYVSGNSQTGQNIYIDRSRSSYVPPPPQSFLIKNQIPQNIMGNTINPTTMVQPTITLGPNVKRTYVPHHIINEIPVYTDIPSQGHAEESRGFQRSDNRQYYQEGNNSGENNDQSQQVLMGFYQKLYEKFQIQKSNSDQLKRTMNQMNNQILNLRNQLQIQSNVNKVQTQPQPQKRYRVDQRRLQLLFQQRCGRTIDQVVSRRRKSCLEQIRKLYQNSQSMFKLTINKSSAVQSSIRYQ